jgi:hypothetical protein
LQFSGGTELQVDSGDTELSPEDWTGCTGPHSLSTLSAPHPSLRDKNFVKDLLRLRNGRPIPVWLKTSIDR